MMEAVGLVDPALVEQAAGPGRRHSARRPLRTGLIAACLCAALLGSAWAANQIGGFQSLKFFEDLLLPAELSDDGEALGEAHYDGYTLEGGIDFLALEDLPQEALDMAAEHPGLHGGAGPDKLGGGGGILWPGASGKRLSARTAPVRFSGGPEQRQRRPHRPGVDGGVSGFRRPAGGVGDGVHPADGAARIIRSARAICSPRIPSTPRRSTPPPTACPQ